MKDENCENKIDEAMASRAEDFRLHMTDPDIYEEGNDEVSPFHEYGLHFGPSYQSDTLEYLLSTGGPADMVRFHPCGKVTYHYQDWFDGAERDVTHKDWAQWLVGMFQDCEMLDFTVLEEEPNWYRTEEQ